MSYTPFTKTELVLIEEYHNFGLSGRKIAKKHSHESIYRVIRQLKQELKGTDVYRKYKRNKSKYVCKRIVLPPDEKEYIKKKVIKAVH